MKKATKIISVMLLIVMALASVANVAFALTPSDIKGDANDNSGIQTVGKKIVGVIQTVGIVTSVIVLAILGIKYMIGSAEEKAEYKKSMIPYIVGAVVLFAASALANVVYNLAADIGNAAQ